jgi:hypothetical protein
MAEIAGAPVPEMETPGIPVPVPLPVADEDPAARVATPSQPPGRSQPTTAQASPASRLRALVSTAPSQTDAFLSHLQRALSTPSGIDTTLLLLCYTTRLAASGLASGAAAAQALLLRRVLLQSQSRRGPGAWTAILSSTSSSAAAVLVATTATTTTAAKPQLGVVGRAGVDMVSSRAGALAAGLAVLAHKLKALSSLASEARMMLRLWGLLDMYFWARGLVRNTRDKMAARRGRRRRRQQAASSSSSSASATTTTTTTSPSSPPRESTTGPPEPLVTLPEAVAYLQLAACVAFQALENGAYLSARGVLGWTPAQQTRAFRWSARFWAVHVGAELGKLAAEGLARRHRLLPPVPRPSSLPSPPDATAQGTGADKEKEEGKGEEGLGAGAAAEGQAEAGADETRWRKQVVRNAAWAPLTLHWSAEEGLVSEAVVGLLGSIPGILQMRDLWRETAA